MRARFSINNGSPGKVGEGEVVQRNPLTTLIRVRSSKLDINTMRWTTVEKIIKRHNQKHGVQII